MKWFVISSMLFVLLENAYSQVSGPDQALTSEYYLKKSKNQTSAALTFLGIGTAAIAGGLLIATTSSGDPAKDVAKIFTGIPLILGGMMADIISIPVFISAASNKRRSIQAVTTLKFEEVSPLAGGSFRQAATPVVAVKVRF